jgi:cell division septum initiation protein DivIVA
MVKIDILYLVDRLEAAISKGLVVPFTAKRMIDEDECLDIIDQMRVAIPEEIKQARRVSQERDRLLAQAKEEADRVVQISQEQAGRMVDQDQVTRAALDRSELIARQAEQEAQTLRDGADAYARDVLQDLQRRLDELTARIATLQGQVNNGLTQLGDHDRSDRLLSPPPPPTRPREPMNQ